MTILVPVLNEEARLKPCLESLIEQGDLVEEILVIDGGSTDGTQELVRQARNLDPRIRLVDATPVPDLWNGKAWNLEAGLSTSDPGSCWILCIDADVRVHPDLASSLVSFADERELQALSAATRQVLEDRGSELLHPAMLTTLVYRFGIPGHIYRDPSHVQVNGQCLLLTRDALAKVGGFACVKMANSEDIALARELVSRGVDVGFFEADDLATVTMYRTWRETWSGWGRSLPVRDRSPGISWAVGVAEVLAVQVAPLLLIATSALVPRRYIPRALLLMNVGLAMARVGVLTGTRRAYAEPSRRYWLSPLADLPVGANLVMNSLRKTHTWRGRRVRREEQT